MDVIVVPDGESVGRAAATAVEQLVTHRPDAVLGVATGSTPGTTYRELARRVEGGLDLSRCSAFALDEYVGIPEGHPESYRAVLDRTVREPLGLRADRVYVPDGGASDLDQACRDYEAAIEAAGGIDLQLLGLGTNGHIGFNEPTSSLRSQTRVKTLSPRTRADNARFFDDPDQVPRLCLTQGLATILRSRHAVLLAIGEKKAPALAQVVEGALSAMWPGTVLQLHQHATVICDEAAAGQLTLRDYYDAASGEAARELGVGTAG